MAKSRVVQLLDPGPLWRLGPGRGPEDRVRGPVVVAYVLGVFVLAPVVAYREVDVVGHAWETCGISSPTAYGFVLAWFLIVLTLMDFLVLWSAMAVYVRGHLPLPPILLATSVLLLVSAWAYFAWSGLPLANESCPGGDPGWWPGWLPPAVQSHT